MSCLTKISLFFLVLTIVCNPTFSDIFSECMGSIHEVFNGDVPSTYHFKLALYSISEKLILSMNDTQDYIRYYEDNVQAIPEFIGRQILYKRHNKTLEYFRSLIQWLVSPISNAHFNLPPESKRPYVLGYFNLLINQFDNPNLPLDIKAMINYHVHTPEKYCINRGINVALYMMLLDPDQPNNEPANMDGYQILKYCYKTFTHLDFTLEKYYPETFDAGNGASYYQRNQLATMASYLAYVLDMTEQAVDEIINYGFQFPTILELCTARSST